jgi:hypothetical protein
MGDGPEQAPDWSPDGKQIAYAQTDASTGDSHIVVANAGGAPAPADLTPNPISANNTSPAFSPAGSQILFSTDRTLVTNAGAPGQDGVWVLNDNAADPAPKPTAYDAVLNPATSFSAADWGPVASGAGTGATGVGGSAGGASSGALGSTTGGRSSSGSGLSPAAQRQVTSAIRAALRVLARQARQIGLTFARDRSAVVKIKVPRAGTVLVVLRRGHVIIARGHRRAGRAGTVKVVIALTRAGRALLRGAARHDRTLRVGDQLSFTAVGARAVTGRRKITLALRS